MSRLPAERRAELERRVYAINGRELRDTIAFYVFAGFIAGMIFAPAAAPPWLLALRATARYVLRDWRLGALLADSEAAEREHRRIATVDLRRAPQ